MQQPYMIKFRNLQIKLKLRNKVICTTVQVNNHAYMITLVS